MMVNDDLRREVIRFSERAKTCGTKLEVLKNHAQRGLERILSNLDKIIMSRTTHESGTPRRTQNLA